MTISKGRKERRKEGRKERREGRGKYLRLNITFENFVLASHIEKRGNSLDRQLMLKLTWSTDREWRKRKEKDRRRRRKRKRR